MADTYGQADALQEIESELGQLMTLNGADYPCIIGARADGHELGAGGYALSAGLEVVVRISILHAAITLKDNITVNGKVQKIDTITNSPDGQFVVLTCNDLNKDS